MGIFFYVTRAYELALDWEVYYLAATEGWENRFTYAVYNPPWLIWFLFPLASLGMRLGFAVLSAFNLGAVIWSIFRLSQDHVYLRLLLVICSFPMLYLLVLGQIDGLILLGLVLMAESPPRHIGKISLGAIISLLKPQMALGGILIGVWKSLPRWKVAGILCLFLCFSVVVWGIWFRQQELVDPTVPWNRAFPLFPLGWIMGLPLLGYGLWKKQEIYGLIAMPFLVPYFGPHSFIGMLVFLVAKVPIRATLLGWGGITTWMLVSYYL